MKLCALNRPKTTVNLTKLISDTLVQLEQEYIPLEVKLRFPEKTVSIQANEEDLKLLMDSLLMGIARVFTISRIGRFSGVYNT